MLKSKRTYDSKMTMCYYKFVDSPIITATIAICSRKDDPIHNNGRYRALERLYRYYKEYPHEMEPITRDMISNINITDDTKVIINCAFGPDLKSLYFDDGNLNDYDLVKNFVML